MHLSKNNFSQLVGAGIGQRRENRRVRHIQTGGHNAMSEKVRFQCSSCGSYGVSIRFSGERAATVSAELGEKGVRLDEGREYVKCNKCRAWCVIE